jgi:hypothetical protein
VLNKSGVNLVIVLIDKRFWMCRRSKEEVAEEFIRLEAKDV